MAALQIMDNDLENRELRSLCEQFKKAMHHQIDAPVFDCEAKARLGRIIGKAALGNSEYANPASPGSVPSLSAAADRG